MKCLDLFCRAGGASMGYYWAGFEVTGVDILFQPDYPFNFIQGDAIEYAKKYGHLYDLIHASPPCQTFTRAKHLRDAQNGTTKVLNLIPETRQTLIELEVPYVIENVPGAPLSGIILCGSSFGLKVRRHRLFESNLELVGSVCDHKTQGRPVGIYGSMRDEIPGGGHTAKTIEQAREAMGIDWMLWGDLVEAIPPRYTFEIGKQLMSVLQ